jgi:hypothetical protein
MTSIFIWVHIECLKKDTKIAKCIVQNISLSECMKYLMFYIKSHLKYSNKLAGSNQCIAFTMPFLDNCFLKLPCSK